MQILATYWELPVSTTHAIVGAVVGMTMVAAGPGAVHWSDPTDTFPFIGVSPIKQPAAVASQPARQPPSWHTCSSDILAAMPSAFRLQYLPLTATPTLPRPPAFPTRRAWPPSL
jgi:hypothetical protein